MLVVYVVMRVWEGKSCRRTQAEEGQDEQGVTGWVLKGMGQTVFMAEVSVIANGKQKHD